MSVKEQVDAAKLRLGAWNRERKERAAEKKAAQQQDGAHVTVPLWLVNATKFASWVATLSLMYFLWLYTLDIARDRAGALHITHAGQWVGEVQFWFPYIVGFALVAFGIPYVAKIAIPTFMSLRWRGNFWPKAWALVIALAVSLVVIAGTFAVQGNTIMERDRSAAVAVEGVQQEAAVMAARIADVQHAMDERLRSPSAYVRTAASMSPEAYDRFVAARRDDWQYTRLVSYRSVSEEMVALNQQMSELRGQQARQTVTAAVQREVTTERTNWIAETLGWLEGVRSILLSLVMDIVALMMPWISLRLEQARNQQVSMAEGIARHPYMLNDMRAEGNVVKERQKRDAFDVAEAVLAGGGDPRWAADMARAATAPKAPRTRATDGETGEELVKVESHWRKLKRGQKHQVQTAPAVGSMDDERGVTTDGGARQATVPTEAKIDSLGQPIAESVPERRDSPTEAQPEQDATEVQELTPEELLATYGGDDPVEVPQQPADDLVHAEAEPVDEPEQQEAVEQADGEDEQDEPDHVALPDNEGVMQQEPHDSHVRARALIAAE